MIISDIAIAKFILSIILVTIPGLPEYFVAFGSITAPYVAGLMLSDRFPAGYAVVILVLFGIFLLLWPISLIFLRIRKRTIHLIGLICFVVLNMFDTVCSFLSYIDGEQSVYKAINAVFSLSISIICIFIFRKTRSRM